MNVQNFLGTKGLVRSALIVGYILAVLLISGLAHADVKSVELPKMPAISFDFGFGFDSGL